jgi:hypothetical protein
MSTDHSDSPESLPHFTLDPYFDSQVMPSQWDLTSFPTKESAPKVEACAAPTEARFEQSEDSEAAAPVETGPDCQMELASSLSTTPSKWDLTEFLNPGSCR